jgi:hypothetical protein
MPQVSARSLGSCIGARACQQPAGFAAAVIACREHDGPGSERPPGDQCSKVLRAASVPGGPCLRRHPTKGDLGFSSTAAIETNFTIPGARA